MNSALSKQSSLKLVILLIAPRWIDLGQFAILTEIVMEDVQMQTSSVEIIYAHLKMKHR